MKATRQDRVARKGVTSRWCVLKESASPGWTDLKTDPFTDVDKERHQDHSARGLGRRQDEVSCMRSTAFRAHFRNHLAWRAVREQDRQVRLHTHFAVLHRLVERFLMDGYQPQQLSTFALTLFRYQFKRESDKKEFTIGTSPRLSNVK